MTWRGIDTQAGAHTDPPLGGETLAVMDHWSPGERIPTDPAGIKQELEDLGPGSSALVLVFWTEDRGAHWFNAFNDKGVITAADGQRGKWDTWPPTLERLGFNEGMVTAVEAIFIDRNGKHLRGDDRKQVP